MIYNLYITKKLFKTFIVVFLISNLIIISNGATPLIWLVEQNSLSFVNLLKLAILFTSQLFFIIFPLSFIFASLIVVAKLFSSKEMLALKSKGVSNYQISRPFILIVVVCFIVSLLFNNFIKPEANYLYADSLLRTYITATKNLFASKKFFSLGKSVSIYIKNSNPDTKYFEDILLLIDDTSNKPNKIITFSKSASLTEDNGKTFLKFDQGQQLINKQNNDYLINFGNFFPDLSDTFKDFESSKRTVTSISTRELLKYFFSDSQNEYSKSRLSEEFGERIVSPWIFLANLGLILILISDRNIAQTKTSSRRIIIPLLFVAIVLFQFVFQIVIYSEISKTLQILGLIGLLIFGLSYLFFSDNSFHLSKYEKRLDVI